MAPSTAACKLASRANTGLSRDIPLAASLMTGFGITFGVDSETSDIKRAVMVLLAPPEGANPEAVVVSKAAVTILKDFMVFEGFSDEQLDVLNYEQVYVVHPCS